MAKSRSELVVGIFVLVVLAAAAYMVLSIQGNPFQETFDLRAHYTRVGGVKAGTPVSLAGHQVGEVVGVAPRPELRKVEVRMAISEEYAGAILTDASATIVPVGFLGDVQIELSYGRYGVPVKAGDVLQGGEPLDWQNLLKGAAGDFSAAMRSVNTVVGDEQLQHDLTQILDNLSRFTDTLNQVVVPDDRAQLQSIFTSLEDTSARIGEAAESLRTLVEQNRENLSATLVNARTITEQVKSEVAPGFADAAQRFSELGARMTTLTEKIDKFVESNSANASEAITGIRDSTKALRETLDTARASLDRIKEGPGTLHDIVYREETSRNLNSALISAGRFFDSWSGFTSGLELKVSAEAKYFFDDPADTHGREDFRTVITNPPPGGSFSGYSETWHEGDGNRAEWDLAAQLNFGDYGVLVGADDVGVGNDLDLLFLGKVPSSGGRLVAGFGVLEGEAGARLEAHLIPDLLYLRLEGIGFTTQDQERLDVSLRAQLWENLYLMGGVESVWGKLDRRTFAGIRYEFGKKFGQKKETAEEADSTWEDDYKSEVEKTGYESTIKQAEPGVDPFAEDEGLWGNPDHEGTVPAEEAPAIKAPSGF